MLNEGNLVFNLKRKSYDNFLVVDDFNISPKNFNHEFKWLYRIFIESCTFKTGSSNYYNIMAMILRNTFCKGNPKIIFYADYKPFKDIVNRKNQYFMQKKNFISFWSTQALLDLFLKAAIWFLLETAKIVRNKNVNLFTDISFVFTINASGKYL